MSKSLHTLHRIAMPKRRKRTKFIPFLLVITFLGGYLIGKQDTLAPQPLPAHTIAKQAIKVQFSPNGECLALIKETINLANHQILVQAYSFTSAEIAETLVQAYKKGIKVQVLVDRSQLTAKGSQVQYVKKQGIAVAVDNVSDATKKKSKGIGGIAHNKVMIIDDMHVLTGSFNWSVAAATRNAENLLLITDKEINKLYTSNWHTRAKYAQPIH